MRKVLTILLIGCLVPFTSCEEAMGVMRALGPASATSVQEQGCVLSVMDTMI